MREYTQTNLDPGNCWQTCVACMLDVEPTTLPDQTKFDTYRLREDGSKEYYGPSYQGALQAYLLKHHGLGYVQFYMPEEIFTAIRPREPGLHMMCGATVRSAANGGRRHVVVARYGEMIWDPHPSRAGLTTDINWAFLIPYPASWKRPGINDDPCVCPACAVA